MDYRRQSRVYIAGMRKGLEAGRSGKRKANVEARAAGTADAGMKGAGSSNDAPTRELPASDRGGERSSLNGGGIRLVWSNPHMTKATGRKSRAALVICE